MSPGDTLGGDKGEMKIIGVTWLCKQIHTVCVFCLKWK